MRGSQRCAAARLIVVLLLLQKSLCKRSLSMSLYSRYVCRRSFVTHRLASLHDVLLWIVSAWTIDFSIILPTRYYAKKALLFMQHLSAVSRNTGSLMLLWIWTKFSSYISLTVVYRFCAYNAERLAHTRLHDVAVHTNLIEISATFAWTEGMFHFGVLWKFLMLEVPLC